MRHSLETINKIKDFHYSGKLPLYIRGRVFGLRELRIILQCIETYFEDGRTRISKEICRRLNWYQPNGWLKDRACRDVLLRLAEYGLVELPPRKTGRGGRSRAKSTSADCLKEFDLDTPITTFPINITLEFAKGNSAETLWNQLVVDFLNS